MTQENKEAQHREELKDNYDYPNSVVYAKNDEIESLKKELEELKSLPPAEKRIE